jgi:type II secretory pathway pseudopilin PulG
MTSPTLPPVTPGEIMAPDKRRRWPVRIVIALAIVVALVLGVVIGEAANNKSSQLNAANATISQQSQKIGSMQGTIGTLRSQYETATQQLADETNTANHALSVATAKVKAQDAARQSQLNQEAATLKTQQTQLAQQQGITQNNTISQDGVYVIGRDMKGGTWHTSGGSQCYYAKLGSADTSNIIDNNNIQGPATVDLSGAYAFDISGGCTWVKVG